MADSYTFKGEGTFKEYFEVHRLMEAKRDARIRGLSLLYVVAVFADWHQQNLKSRSLLEYAISWTILLYPRFVSPVLFRIRVSRNWNRHARMKKTIDLTVTPDGLNSKDDLGNPVNTAWRSFYRFQETDSLFVLHIDPQVPLCLPKRLLAEGDHAAVRQLLSAVNAPKPPGEPLA